MSLLHAGVDTSVIALWLGHAGVRSTDTYLHADISIKEKALALTTQAEARPGRYRPTDQVLAFLKSLRLCPGTPRHTQPQIALLGIVAVSA
jgi:integrase